jgi:RecA-family ATPase
MLGWPWSVTSSPTLPFMFLCQRSPVMAKLNGATPNPQFVALSWAADGYKVFPCDPKTQRSLLPDGTKSATTDPDIIVGWWIKYPQASLGFLPKAPVVSATAFHWTDPANIPPRRFVYGRHYIRQFLSTTIAPGGVGKSSLGTVEALAMASGRGLLGIQPERPVRVWLFNGEDPLEELQRRIMAAAIHYGLTAADFEGRLFVDSGRRTPIIMAEQTRDGAKIAVPVVDAVTETIHTNGIDVMIVDPFVSSHRVSENDNNAVERVAKTWSSIADQTECSIDLVHHSRKTGGAEVTVEDGRGASALLSAARSARVLNGMTQDEADKAGVENRRLFFQVDNGKANLVAPLDNATWLKVASVGLANGDNVGVVTQWSWPDPFDDITVADLRAAQRAVAAGGPLR